MAPRFAILAVLTVALPLLSGCVGDDAEEANMRQRKADAAKSAAAIDTELEQTLKAALHRPGSGNLRDWWALALNTTADGMVAAFEWTIPDGAVLSSRVNRDIKNVHLEIVPIVMGPEPTRWSLGTFRFVDAKAVFAGALVRGATETQSRFVGVGSLPPTSGTAMSAASTTPGFFSLFGTNMEPGERVYIVLAAATQEPAQFGLAFRARDEAPGFETAPVDSVEAFVKDVEGLAGRSLKEVGVGAGFSYGAYSETNLMLATSMQQFVRKSGDVKVAFSLPDENRVGFAVRETAISMDVAVEHGFTMANAFYFGDDAAGRWSATISTHGFSRTFRGLILETGTPVSVSSMLFGNPAFSLISEGQGRSRTEFTLTGATTNQFEFVAYSHLTFGAPLKNLIGFEAAPLASSYHGLAGNVPPAMATYEHGELVLRGSGVVTQRFQL